MDRFIPRYSCTESTGSAIKELIVLSLLFCTDAEVKLTSCRVLEDKVPGKSYDYSDHLAVEARMSVKRNVTG